MNMTLDEMADVVERGSRAIDMLRAEVAALRRDAERVNWLSANVRVMGRAGYAEANQWWWQVALPDADSLREAIDAAIAASQKDIQEPLVCKDDTLAVRHAPAGHDEAGGAT